MINKSPLGKYTGVFYYGGGFQKVVSQGKKKNAELVVYFRGDWRFFLVTSDKINKVYLYTNHDHFSTLYTITSVCIFSILFYIHYLRC